MKAWSKACLGELVEIAGGGTPTRSEASYYGGSIPWVTPKDMKAWELWGSEITITEEGVRNSATRLVSPNSVLIVVRSGVLKHTLPVSMNRVQVAINQDMKALTCRQQLHPDYLAHFLRANSRAILSTVRATTADNFPTSILRKMPVPLPPLDEQRRIAAILDQADALRAKRRAALAQLDTLTKSIFTDTFGNPRTNHREFPIRGLEEIAECLDRMRKPVKESERRLGPIPYYGANGQQGWIDEPLFNEPLVLVAEDGGFFDTPERGVAYRVDGPSWVNNHAHVLRPKAEKADIEFLHRALRHYDFTPYISGTTRSKLTQQQMNQVKVVVPPLNLQHDFAKRVAAIERIKSVQQASLSHLDTLFASLQHRAFRGDL